MCSLNDGGIELIASKLGKTVSPPSDGYIGGRRFVKIRALIPISEPLKDRVRATHHSLGELKVFCVYEKINRICSFCGALGHEFATCHDHERLTEIYHRSPDADQSFAAKLLSPKRGAWMTNASLVPLQEATDSDTFLNNKRRYVSPNGRGSEYGPTRPLAPLGLPFSSQSSSGSEATATTPTKRQRLAGLSLAPLL